MIHTGNWEVQPGGWAGLGVFGISYRERERERDLDQETNKGREENGSSNDLVRVGRRWVESFFSYYSGSSSLFCCYMFLLAALCESVLLFLIGISFRVNACSLTRRSYQEDKSRYID
jgi:hypothetical protein